MPGMAGIDFISDLYDQVGAWADAFLSETSLDRYRRAWAWTASEVALSRRGAAMKNLANSVSLHSNVKTAPSKSGIKHQALQTPAYIVKYKFETTAWPNIAINYPCAQPQNWF